MSLIAQKLISASGATEETDDDFNLVTGLYHFDGSNGAQNNTLLDSSPESHTVTRNADIVQGSFSPFYSEEGKWSASFDGTDDYLQIPTSDDFAFGTGDFTIEMWVFRTTTGMNFTYEGRDGGNANRILIYFNGSNQLTVSASGTKTDSETFPTNEWVHIALVRSGTTGYLFKNGDQRQTWTIASDYSFLKPSSTLYIGTTNSTNNYWFGGFISNLRVLKGTALYAGSSYTVPTAPLTAITNTKLLTCCSNRFRDKSTSAHRVAPNASGVNHMTSTNLPKVQPFSPFAPSSSYSAASKGGSGFFDQTSDCYFDVSDATDFDFGTGDYTVEMWVYPTTTFIVNWAMAFNTIGVNQYWAWTDGGGNSAAAGLSSYPSGNYSGSFDHMPNRFSWSHIVFQNTSGTENWYINGVRVYNATNNPSFSASATGVRVGLSPAYASQFFYGGYISDVRVLKGSNAYSNASTLTVPTAPLGSVTNTKLLTNFTNAAIFDQTGKTNIDTVGNAQLDTSVKKFGTASAEFDGTGDYLFLPSQPTLSFPSDFTIELFFNSDSFTGYKALLASANYYNAAGSWLLRATSATSIAWASYNASGANEAYKEFTVPSMSTGTWYHLAAVRSSGSINIYLNGTVSSSGALSDSKNLIDGSVNGVYVGYEQTFSANGDFDGYIDELRITKKARYTSNFTAPTKAFPNL